ncbi:MAG TPA: YicC/YloC family endoribonuclease [Syntrophales bacterium]|nr:YicC/YloC family endoribonuclease [Syntrophales bacterium]
MIQSMTGYGRTEEVLNGRRYTVEIKSLNHRYLEISIRLPAIISFLELEIKKKISGRLNRGRIELNVRMDSEYGAINEGRYELNIPLIQNYYELLKQLREELGLKEEITLNMVAGFRDVFVLKEPDLDLSVAWEELEMVLGKAMDALMDMRKKEGEVIYQDLVQRVDLIMKSLDSIESRAPQVILEYRKRLGDRVKELTGGIVVDDLRLGQEVAIMAEKSDIMEEIVRLKSHIIQFGDLLKGNDAVGRNIDFLIQEMIREVNTIGSKSSDAGISKMVIDIKSELARIREQAQNIE